MATFICYDRCSTCKKAEKWLIDHKVGFDKRPIKENNPTKAELKKWQALSGLPLKKFFNTSGMLYRDMGLKDKLKDMSDEDMLKLLATDGMLVKRPLFVTDKNVLIGFKEEQWSELLCK